jgi:hypothetical protein
VTTPSLTTVTHSTTHPTRNQKPTNQNPPNPKPKPTNTHNKTPLTSTSPKQNRAATILATPPARADSPPLTSPYTDALDLAHLAPPPFRISPQSPSLLFLLFLVSHFWNGDSFLSCLLILSYVTFLCILSGSVTSYLICLFVFVINKKFKKKYIYIIDDAVWIITK